MPNTTPLTDAINALTTYANETTGASDTNLSDAVGTLVSGYGGGGGSGIGVQTAIPNILNMFYALENGTAVTGQYTPSEALPNTEQMLFSTGLTTIHGIFIADESQSTLNTANTPENTLFGIVFDPVSDNVATSDYSGYTYAISRMTIRMEHTKEGISGRFLNRGSWRVDNGNFYYTAPYNKNDNYCAFHSNHTYRWVAW